MNAPVPENQRAEDILRAALHYFGLTRRLLVSTARHEPIAYQRQVIMYTLREYAEGLSFPTIGRMVGRDHSTVIHDCAKIADVLAGKVKDANLTERAIRDVAAIRSLFDPKGDVVSSPSPPPIEGVDRRLLVAVREELRALQPRLAQLFELVDDRLDQLENSEAEPKKRGILIGDAKGGVAK